MTLKKFFQAGDKMQVTRGQKVSLTENFLKIKFERNSGAVEIDTAAFLLGEDGKTSGDEDFIFYGNAKHNSGGVIHREDDSIEIDLQKIPERVKKISFTATIYDAKNRRQNFSKVTGAVLKIFSASNAEIFSFTPEKFNIETAIVLGEIYRYKGSWKFNAVGAGFNGGLAALCKNFGIEVSEDQNSSPPPVKISSPPRQKIVIPPPPQNNFQQQNHSQTSQQNFHQPLNLSQPQNFSIPRNSSPQPKKIELQRGSRHRLSTQSGSLGIVEINLRWNSPQKSKKNIDLDLGCLFELDDEFVGAVQSLGNFFGSLNDEPYIKLNRDDRTGQTYNGETLKINGSFLRKIRRVLVFATIYSGTSVWKDAAAFVTIKNSGEEILVKLDEVSSKKSTCAILLLENVGNTFTVEKILNFYYDSKEMDEDFDWGLEWTSGSKD